VTVKGDEAYQILLHFLWRGRWGKDWVLGPSGNVKEREVNYNRQQMEKQRGKPGISAMQDLSSCLRHLPDEGERRKEKSCERGIIGTWALRAEGNSGEEIVHQRGLLVRTKSTFPTLRDLAGKKGEPQGGQRRENGRGGGKKTKRRWKREAKGVGAENIGFVTHRTLENSCPPWASFVSSRRKEEFQKEEAVRNLKRKKEGGDRQKKRPVDLNAVPS